MSRITSTFTMFLVAGRLSAQIDADTTTSQDAPRWTIGYEILIPILNSAQNYHDTHRIELMGAFEYRTGRSVRVGYLWMTYESSGSAFYLWADSLARVVNIFSASDLHLAELGHQWTFGNWCVRPFVGADAVLGHLQVFGQRFEEDFLPDSLSGSMFSGPTIASRYEVKSERSWVWGARVSVGAEIKLHKHLFMQLRLGASMINLEPLSRIGYHSAYVRYGPSFGVVEPSGTGVYVQFRF